MKGHDDVSSFRMLAMGASIAAILVSAVVVCLVRMGAPRHLLGAVADLCMTAGHVASEVVSGALAVVVVLSTVAGALTLALTWSRTRQFTAGFTQVRAPDLRLRRCIRNAGVETERVFLVRDERMLAFTSGLRKPRVFISTGTTAALDDDELQAVLAHEGHHLRRRDPLKLFWAQTATRAFFWLPILGDMRKRYEVAAEAAADARCVARQGSRLPLMRAVLQFDVADLHPSVAVAALSGGELADERLRLLLDKDAALPPVTTVRAALLSTATITLLVGLLVVHLSLPGM